MQVFGLQHQHTALIIGAIALAVAFLVAVAGINAQSAAATSLLPTTNISSDDDPASDDPITSILAEKSRIVSEDIAFLEQNLLMPGYDESIATSPAAPAEESVSVLHGLDLPWGENQIAY